MPEETVTPPAPTTTTEPPESPGARTVPYDRFKQVNDKANALASTVEELSAWKEEQEAKNLSELERAAKAREQAEQRATEAEQRVVRLERGGWVTAAAASADFDDPADALAFINLDEIESERDAKRAVKELGERKPKLLKDKTPGPPQVGRVIDNGQAVTPGAAPAANGEQDLKQELGAGIFDYLAGRQAGR